MIYALQFTVVTIATTLLRAGVIIGMAIAYAQALLVATAIVWMLSLIF